MIARAAYVWPKAVIFDLDGTLVDSAPDIADALNEGFAPLGGPAFTLDEVKAFIGGGALAMIRKAIDTRGHVVDEARWAELMARFIAAYKVTSARGRGLFPGADTMLSTLRANGCRLAICSNKAHAVTVIAVPALGIAHHFDVVLGAEDARAKKPARDMIDHILAGLGVGHGDAIMVGDSGADVNAAKAAGIPVVVVDFGYAKGPVSALGANRVISHLGALPEVLAELQAQR
jgi:phosphoglycolate phosphatase